MMVIGLVLGLFVLNVRLVSMADSTTERLWLLLTTSDRRNTVDASGIHAPTSTINPTLNRSSVLWCFKHDNAIEMCDRMFYFYLGLSHIACCPLFYLSSCFNFTGTWPRLLCDQFFSGYSKGLSDIRWCLKYWLSYFLWWWSSSPFGLFVSPSWQ